MEEHNKKSTGYFLLLAGIFVVGAALRFYLLPSQLLLDDEWHSLSAVIGRSYGEVLTQFNPVDNTSVLFNLYDLVLYRNYGWSELTLRLPVIVAGLASLIVLPLLVRRVFNQRVSLVFAGLLAVSPILVSYSRYARAYELVVLLGYSALLLACLWLKTGRTLYAVGYVLAGVGAIYGHLFAVVAIYLPLALGLGLGFVSRFRRQSPIWPEVNVSLKSLGMVMLLITVMLLPLMWPVFLVRDNLPWAGGKLSLNGVITAANLMTGTSNGAMNILFFGLLLGGGRFLLKYYRLPGWLFPFTAVGYVLVLLVSRPKGLDNGAILLRYMILVVPLALTTVAVALDRLMAWMQERGVSGHIRVSGMAGIIGLFFAIGPLPAIYHPPNNFTNHSAYQASYQKNTWEMADAHSIYPGSPTGTNQVPAFYPWLKDQTNVQTVIEYPMDVSDYNNLLYYYQHFHGHQILAGYCSDKTIVGNMFTVTVPTNVTVGASSADQFLSRVDPTKSKFRNMVDVSSPTAISGSGADIVILHKYIQALMASEDPVAGEVYGAIPVYYHSVVVLKDRFARDFGPPIYEDDRIICFRITPK